MGLKPSLSFSFDGVCLLGLDSDEGCMIGCPSPDALAGEVLLDNDEFVELEREGAGVGAAHVSVLGLCDTNVRQCDGSSAGLGLNFDMRTGSSLRALVGDDLVSATVLGLSRCCSLFFLGVECDDTTRRTWWVCGGRRLASSWAFNLEPVRPRLAVDGLPLIASPTPARDNWALPFSTSCSLSYACWLLGVTGAAPRLDCDSR